MREASSIQPPIIIFFHVDMHTLCQQRPSLIVFPKLHKLVYFKLAKMFFFRGQ